MSEAGTPIASPARRRFVATLYGTALGAWWGLVFLLLVRATDRGWWLLPFDRIQLDRIFGYEHVLLPFIARKFGIEFPALEIIVLALAAAGGLLGWLCSMLGQWLRIDPEQASRQALVDVAGSVRFVALFLGLPVLIAVVGSAWFEWTFVACYLYLMLSPFLVSNRDWLGWTGSAPTPRPRWPGWRTLLTATIFALAGVVFDFALKGLDALLDAPASALLSVLAWPLEAALLLVASAIWIDRFERLQSVWAQRGRLLAWKAFAAFLAMQVRLTALFAWIVPVLLSLALLSIWVLPQLEELLKEQNRPVPEYLFAPARLARDWWNWLIVIAPVLGAAYGRLYVRLFPRSLNEGIAPARV